MNVTEPNNGKPRCDQSNFGLLDLRGPLQQDRLAEDRL